MHSSKIVIALSCFLAFSGLSYAQFDVKCNENEIFLEKGGVECGCNHHCWKRSSAACMCVEGFVRNIHQECVPLEQCTDEIQCDDNQIAVECHNACAPTCDDPDRYPCPDQPCYPACVCKGDYVLRGNGSENVCVPKTQCPTKTTTVRPPLGDPNLCGENAEFAIGKVECICGEHCYTSQSISCICKDGFVKHNGTCISNEQCFKLFHADPECGPNEEQVPCEDPCPKTCGMPDRAECYSYQCTFGCRCKPGTLFDEIARDCVPIGTCTVVEPEQSTEAPCLVPQIENSGEERSLHKVHNHLFKHHGKNKNSVHTKKNHKHSNKNHNKLNAKSHHHKNKNHHSKKHNKEHKN